MTNENDGSDYTGIDKNKKEDQNKSMRELSLSPINLVKFLAGIPKAYTLQDCTKLIEATNIRYEIIATTNHLYSLLNKLDNLIKDE